MDFMDALDGAWKFLKDAGEKTGNTGKDLLGAATFGPGVALDIARWAAPDTKAVLNKGFAKHVNAQSGADALAGLVAGQDTLTGIALDKVASGFHYWSEHGWNAALEAPLIVYGSNKTDNPVSWKDAYNTSLKFSPGDVLRMTTAADIGFNINYNNPLSGDIAHKWLDDVPNGGLANTLATIDGFGWELVDPTFAGAAGAATKGIRGLGKLSEARGLDSLIGKIHVKPMPEDAVEGQLPDVEFTPGKLDHWNRGEILDNVAGLKTHPQGERLAEILDESRFIKDPATKIDVRNAVRQVLNKNVDGIVTLNKNAPLLGRELQNMVARRSTGGIDAGIAEDAARDAGDASFHAYHQPEVVADAAAAAKLDPLFGPYTDLLIGGKSRTLRAKARAKPSPGGTAAPIADETTDDAAALAGSVEHTVDESGDIPERVILGGSSNLAPIEIFSKGLRAVAWPTGIPSAVRAGKALATNLREPRVYGMLDVQDAHLTAAVAASHIRIAGFSEKTGAEFMDRLIGGNEATRGSAFNGLQQAAVHALAYKHGVDADLVQRLLDASAEEYRSAMTAVDGQRYSASELPDGTLADHLVIPDAERTAIVPNKAEPVFATQSVNKVLVYDLRKVDNWLKNEGRLHAITRKIGLNKRLGLASTAIQNQKVALVRDFMEEANGWWKTAQLLGRPGAYGSRNLLEEELRVGVLRDFVPVLARSFRQHKYLTATGKVRGGKQAERLIKADPDLEFWGNEVHMLEAELGAPRAQAALAGYERSIAEQTDRLNKATQSGDTALAASIKSHIDHIKTNGDYAYYKDLEAQRDARVADIEQRKAELGQGKLPDSAPFTIPGTDIEAEGAFGGASGPAFYAETGSKAAGFDTSGAMIGRLHGKRVKGYSNRLSVDRHSGADELDRHLNAWVESLNRHIHVDALTRKLLDVKAEGGTSEDIYDAALAFLDSPKSASYRALVPTRTDNERWAAGAATTVDQYVPSAELADILRTREVGKQELASMFDVDARPMVHETGVSAEMGARMQGRDKRIQEVFGAISRMTTDQLVRHPAFALWYEDDLSQGVLALWRHQEKAGIKPAISPEVMRSLSLQARKTALSKMKRSFYHTTDRSNASHQLRFLSPFFAAHQDSIRFWTQAAAENPEFLRKAMTIYSGLEQAKIVTDQDGNPKKVGDFIDANDKITLSLPGIHRELHPASALLMLQQGSVTNPGFGPFAQFSAKWLMDGFHVGPIGFNGLHFDVKDDDWEKVAEIFNPFGPPEGLRSNLPRNWQHFANSLNDSWRQNSPELTDMWFSQVQAGMTDFYKKHDNAEPTDKQMRQIAADAGNAVRWITLQRAIEGTFLPTQATPKSPYSALQDELNRERDKARREGNTDPYAADKAFLAKHGRALVALTKSPSMGSVHMDATSAAGASALRHKSLMRTTNPDIWGLIVGPEARNSEGVGGDFNAGTYHYLKEQLMASPDYKSRDSTMQYMYDVQVAHGWADYDRDYALLMSVAQSRGLDGPEQDPELLDGLKRLRERIGNENEQWKLSADFNKKDRDFQSILDSARQVADNKALLRDSGRSDVKMLGMYLRARDSVEAEYERRKALPDAPQSFDSKQYNDLRWALADYVMYLKEKNTNFETYTMRYVVNKDPFYDEDILTAAKGEK